MPTAFQKRLATLAQQQFDKYHLLRENQEPLASQIAAYWQDIGLSFPGTSTAWSAVFVSWCVKKAGATAAQFKFSQAHSQFVFQAIDNERKGVGVFRGHSVDTYAPKVGDILQNNRGKNHFDFSFAATHKAYESHSAIVMEVGVDTKGNYLRTIGGNESDSVGLKEVRLDKAGRVVDPTGVYICVIETLL
jgi:hypothetical protein